ncbi:chemotaxis protein CheD [Oribacterium sp. oral taxon 102]|uniref:chemotaxis protein CheD n=1 Tax=Oribacterium sp. oral taxon 102 TaxID=671214 RepID=UPI0015BDC580|nr:chemotaxis protein CheD [Oribacterium sp. oral taxon 102]NWO21791.1 chemotaxis protein CheD [Oribacterium sp. oral taxon 102]
MDFEKQLKVGIGDMKLTRGEGCIITYALGSCIGISIYDPYIKLGSLLHIMLPERVNQSDMNLYKYADTGLRETIRKLSAFGAVKARSEVKIAGGAKMFEISGNQSFGNIGERNAAMVRKLLREEGLRLIAEDTGANYARTMSLNVATGDVLIRTYGRQDVHL